jgi:DNA polymerase-1
MSEIACVDHLARWIAETAAVADDTIAVALSPGVGLGLADATRSVSCAVADPAAVIGALDARIRPRWVWWDRATPDTIVAGDVHVGRCWDVLAVHRLLHGTWRTSIGETWASLHGLSVDDLPQMGQLDLLGAPTDEGTDPDDPVRPDGHLRPEWTCGGWAAAPERLARWAAVAMIAHHRQRTLIDERPDPVRVRSTAHAESAAELLCAELADGGLPFDIGEATRIITDAVGHRPTDPADEIGRRAERDDAVLAHLPTGPRVDLRNPADVRAMLRRVSVDIPDTRAWRLEQHRDDHPVVAALLAWRKAERIATTYGYRWLDEHVRDGRLRGDWSSSDGAAGRMTATAGLHNLPAELRPAVRADPGHRFVRADLGQVEPRVLAAVSGDPALIAATANDDLYRPVADRLGVARDIAKVAVLGAMYGATTGESAHALRRLEQEYPTAMSFLEQAADAGRRGDDVMTIGGRLVRIRVDRDLDGDIDRARRIAAARGRYARNAVIQGAAAELFKVWAATVRARGREIDAKIVLCLHDELLVHVPEDRVDAASAVVSDALGEAAERWSPDRRVRFTADLAVITRWSDAPH